MVGSSAPRSCSIGRGTRTRTRSRTLFGSRSRRCGNGWANPGSSTPLRASATASTVGPPIDMGEGGMVRRPGVSVRTKLTLSYAGFLMLAGGLLLAIVWAFLLRYVPDGVFLGPGPNRSDLVRAFGPRAAAVLLFLLAFGLVGGWILAGRMLAPLTRITDATRKTATGSLSHRIQLPGRHDEF